MSDLDISPKRKLIINLRLLVSVVGILTGVYLVASGIADLKNTETVSCKEKQPVVTSGAETYVQYNGDVYYYVDEDNTVHVLTELN